MSMRLSGKPRKGHLIRSRPGAVCSEVDAAARKFIYQEGYEGCFSHGLGHSVGVEVHENPRFNEVCNDRLVPGM